VKARHNNKACERDSLAGWEERLFAECTRTHSTHTHPVLHIAKQRTTEKRGQRLRNGDGSCHMQTQAVEGGVSRGEREAEERKSAREEERSRMVETKGGDEKGRRETRRAVADRRETERHRRRKAEGHNTTQHDPNDTTSRVERARQKERGKEMYASVIDIGKRRGIRFDRSAERRRPACAGGQDRRQCYK
jgi:hypothetical protein